MQQIIAKSGPPTDVTGTQKLLSRKLSHLEWSLNAALAAVEDDHDDAPLVEQYQEQLTDYKQQLTLVHEDLAVLDLEDGRLALKTSVALVQLLASCQEATLRSLFSRCKGVYSGQQRNQTTKAGCSHF